MHVVRTYIGLRGAATLHCAGLPPELSCNTQFEYTPSSWTSLGSKHNQPVGTPALTRVFVHIQHEQQLHRAAARLLLQPACQQALPLLGHAAVVILQGCL